MPELLATAFFPSRPLQRLEEERSFILDVDEATGAPRLTTCDLFGSESRNGLLCGNNPVNHSDPSGLASVPITTKLDKSDSDNNPGNADRIIVNGGLGDLAGLENSLGFRDVTSSVTGGLDFANQGGGSAGSGGRGGGGHGNVGRMVVVKVTHSHDSNRLGRSPGAPITTQGFWTNPNGTPTGNAWLTTYWTRILVTSFNDPTTSSGAKPGPGTIAVGNTSLSSLSDPWRQMPVNYAYPVGTAMVIYFDDGQVYGGTVQDWGRGNLFPRSGANVGDLPNGVRATDWIDIWDRSRQILEWATVAINVPQG